MERQDETSPLLPKNAANPADAPNESPPTAEMANGDTTSHVKSADGGESQASGKDRAAQYEGMPEVKAKLKYILPAIGIGVGNSPWRMHRILLMQYRSFWLLRTKPLLLHVTAKLAATWRR